MLNPPATNLHVSESTSDVIPGFRIEQLGTGDAAMEYRRIQSSVSSGIHAADNNAFKICGASTLMGPAYQTPDQLLRIHTQSGVDKGITDINHQSRVRAHLDIMANILPGIWTTIFFRSVDFDEHLEYIPQAGQFIARKDGYYQVNSRVEYNPSESFMFTPQGFVSIAIYKNSTSYAEGNNLQITDSQSNVFYHNNAPNVSDVLWLQAGDAVEIKTFQTYTMMPNPAFIQPNHEKTYFSIHKIS
jgi:hypothetical protein